MKEGENIIPWDGLGEGGERMFAGPYRFVVKIKTEDGKELAKEIHDANVPFETWLISYRLRVLQELLKEEDAL